MIGKVVAVDSVELTSLVRMSSLTSAFSISNATRSPRTCGVMISVMRLRPFGNCCEEQLIAVGWTVKNDSREIEMVAFSPSLAVTRGAARMVTYPCWLSSRTKVEVTAKSAKALSTPVALAPPLKASRSCRALDGRLRRC